MAKDGFCKILIFSRHIHSEGFNNTKTYAKMDS